MHLYPAAISNSGSFITELHPIWDFQRLGIKASSLVASDYACDYHPQSRRRGVLQIGVKGQLHQVLNSSSLTYVNKTMSVDRRFGVSSFELIKVLHKGYHL